MEMLDKKFQLTIPASKEHIRNALEQLTGWQPNRHNWQQGRVRTLVVPVDTHEQMLLTLTTSFVGLIPLAQLHIRLDNNTLDKVYTANVRAKFARGVFVFAAFFLIFFAAITASHYTILLKLSFYAPICLICYLTFRGIYRDKENLITDLIQIQKQLKTLE